MVAKICERCICDYNMYGLQRRIAIKLNSNSFSDKMTRAGFAMWVFQSAFFAMSIFHFLYN